MSKRILVVSVLLLMAAGAAEASTSAWVWGNNPVAPSYTPFAARAYNPAGGAITITRPGVGAYRVRFAGLAPLASTGPGILAGNVQVTTFGIGNCALQNWVASGADVIVALRCFNAAGAATDVPYTVLYTFN
jgi:hypothetical protein